MSIPYSESLIPTAPSAPPYSVNVFLNGTSTDITVQWRQVEPCIHKNGHITGHSVRYGEVGTSEGERIIKPIGERSSIICGFTKQGFYTVELAAVNSAGTGVYSESFTIEIPGGK